MKYLIKYQSVNGNIMLEVVEAENTITARFKFYMEHTGVDILEIKEEVENEI